MATQNVPEKLDQKIVRYVAADGQEINLNIDMVKKYLITPATAAESVTLQEFVFFLNICRSRGLNPFIKDVYPVKYGSDPLAIITSIDFLRKRAAAEADCEGWDKGVIVYKKETKEARESAGIVLPGEEVIGGWFRGYKKGWRKDFYLEVNLSGYLKKTKEGNLTRFWQEANWPTMISKVAEAQGLRTMWPGKFSKMFLAEEIGTADYEPPVFEIPEAIDIETHGRFEELVAEQKLSPEDHKLFEEYCEFQAKKNKVEMEILQGMVERDFANFMGYFKVYKTKHEVEARMKTLATDKAKSPEEKKPKEKPEGNGPRGGPLFEEGKDVRGEGEKPTN